MAAQTGMYYLLACEQSEVHTQRCLTMQLHCARLSSLSWSCHSAYCVFIHSAMRQRLTDTSSSQAGTGLRTRNTAYQGHRSGPQKVHHSEWAEEGTGDGKAVKVSAGAGQAHWRVSGGYHTLGSRQRRPSIREAWTNVTCPGTGKC